MPDLDRFVAAQDEVWPQVTAELGRGRKVTHWMWFVFPQLVGLGRSPTARFYALNDVAEASAYLAHPILGPRLHEATTLVLAHKGRSAESVLGPVDAAKLRSSMTLFAEADPAEPLFPATLAAFFSGPDPRTIALLGR